MIVMVLLGIEVSTMGFGDSMYDDTGDIIGYIVGEMAMMQQ